MLFLNIMVVLTMLLVVVALAGAGLAGYIRRKKTSHTALVCPLHSNCAAVTESEYSRFLGIPVELLGIAYYGVIALAYALFLVAPDLAAPSVTFAVLALSIAAVVFSGYLTFIQAALLKQWCVWCLCSAGLCVVIFALALASSELEFLPLLSAYRPVIVISHLLGVALGLGGATISDVLFFRFLKDFRISEKEAEVLRVLSQVIWAGLILLIVTGVALYLPAAERLNESAKFLMKMFVVAVLLVNGLFLNLLVSPQLVHISFREPHTHPAGHVRHLRRIAFALGAISMVSWYTAFFLGALRPLPLSLPALLGSYATLLVVAISASQIAERLLERRAAA